MVARCGARMLEDLRRERVLLGRYVVRSPRAAAGRCTTRRRTSRRDSGSSTRCRRSRRPSRSAGGSSTPASRSRAPASRPPKPPPMTATSTSSVTGLAREARLDVRVVDVVRELADDLEVLFVAVGRSRLSRSSPVFGAKPIRVEAELCWIEEVLKGRGHDSSSTECFCGYAPATQVRIRSSSRRRRGTRRPQGYESRACRPSPERSTGIARRRNERTSSARSLPCPWARRIASPASMPLPSAVPVEAIDGYVR